MFLWLKRKYYLYGRYKNKLKKISTINKLDSYYIKVSLKIKIKTSLEIVNSVSKTVSIYNETNYSKYEYWRVIVV